MGTGNFQAHDASSILVTRSTQNPCIQRGSADSVRAPRGGCPHFLPTLALLIALAVVALVAPAPADAHRITTRACYAAAPSSMTGLRYTSLRACLANGKRHNTGHARLAAAVRCNASVPAAIACAFGPYAAQARRVAYCESTYRTAARNGQYLGIFQMGSAERARYGHGATALAQAQAARRYFVASGRDWSPWSCRP